MIGISKSAAKLSLKLTTTTYRVILLSLKYRNPTKREIFQSALWTRRFAKRSFRMIVQRYFVTTLARLTSGTTSNNLCAKLTFDEQNTQKIRSAFLTSYHRVTTVEQIDRPNVTMIEILVKCGDTCVRSRPITVMQFILKSA